MWLFGRKTADNAPHKAIKSIETQDGLVKATKQNLDDSLNKMYSDFNQFITVALTHTVDGIRFVQACQTLTGIEVQVGLENKNGASLVGKSCTQEECTAIFERFFTTAEIQNIDEYEPVRIIRP